MRRVILSLLSISLLLSSCSTEEVVEVQENVFEASSFEIENVSFTPANNFEFTEPYGFEVLSTDVTLVYLEDGTVNGQSVWKLLPQTFFLPNGNEVEYNFEFTQSDVTFFIDTADFSLLTPDFTDNQVFRVVVIPVNNVGRMDFSDINAVMEAYNITSFPKR